jgi:hypothetical protein
MMSTDTPCCASDVHGAPLEPLAPLVPLVPLAPLVPLVPLVPLLAPLVPLLAPLVPEVPLEPSGGGALSLPLQAAKRRSDEKRAGTMLRSMTVP